MSEPSDEKTNKIDTTPTSPHKTNAAKSQDLITKVLDFLSTASNEKLSICVLGLGVATYFVLGRVGLLLIGTLGGIVLHAIWDGSNVKDDISLQAEQRRQKDSSLRIVERILDWKETQSLDVSTAEPITTESLDFNGFPPETAAALNHIVDRAIDDYVKWWYSPILPAELSFPQKCRHTLTSFLLTFSNHLAKKRAEDVFLNFLTNSTSIFIVFLGELSRALMAPGANGKDTAEAIAQYLADTPDSSFATVLDRSEQSKKLKAVSEDVLQTFLEPKAYQFDPARTFLKEVLAGLILEPTLVNCSKAEWINGWIVYLLEEGEPEIMNAINAGVGEATGKQIPTPAAKLEVPKDEPSTSTESDDEDREALEEVKRLNALIAEEQSKHLKEVEEAQTQEQHKPMKESEEVASSAPSTGDLLTPTSSQSDLAGSRSYTSLHEEASSEPEEPEETSNTEQAPMTSFDQILPQEQMFTEPAKQVPLTLYKAVVTIFDDSQPGDKSTIRSKPSIDYLLQIEPASSQHPGWMIARKYADFETLHEVLRRISVISGTPEFNKKFALIPAWKGQTKNGLVLSLEAYLREALSHARLAESEGMKRFLEKDQGLEKLGASKGVLGFPSPEAFQTMGKGMLDVLASAPKGAAGGGKALLDGMKGVGGVFTGQKRSTSRPSQNNRTTSVSTLPRMSEDQSSRSDSVAENGRASDINDDSMSASRTSIDTSSPPPLPTRPSSDVVEQSPIGSSLSANTSRVSFQQNHSLVAEVIPENEPVKRDASVEEEILNLPPRPDEIDDQETTRRPQIEQTSMSSETVRSAEQAEISDDNKSNGEDQPELPTSSTPITPKSRKVKAPFSTEETAVAVELIFAAISELYTLSSVWNIRKALLNAAKAFLIRPGNPSLEQIRTLLQESVIEANTTDAGIAYQLQKLRENSLPTEAEFAQWPPPLSEEAKEKLRQKARKLLVEQGLPPALRGIMGAAASGEALGRLFDSLQVAEVSRGLMFAVMLQSIRAVTH